MVPIANLDTRFQIGRFSSVCDSRDKPRRKDLKAIRAMSVRGGVVGIKEVILHGPLNA